MGKTRAKENEHWSLVEDRNGQVGYAPAAFLVIILDTTAEEEESGATKKGQDDSTEENRIGGWSGLEGERRKSYSAAVIDGIERNSRIYVGDSIVRKTDSRLSNGKDVVVSSPGARIEHVTERVEQIMGRGNGGAILVHVGTNNADKEGTTAILEKYRKLPKKKMAKWVESARLGTELARLSTELARLSTELARLSTESARLVIESARLGTEPALVTWNGAIGDRVCAIWY